MSKDRTGYVFNQKGKWYARVTVQDSSGRRRNIKRRAESKSNAKELLKALLSQLENEGEKAIDAAQMTFNHLADYYAAHYMQPAEYRDGRRISGLRDVVRAAGVVAQFRLYFGNKKLRSITYGDIASYKRARMQTPTHMKHPRTIATMNRELVVLRRMLNIAFAEGWLLKNPFKAGDSLISPSDERKRERILTLDEERRLLEACEHPQRTHLRLLLIALLDTGARKGEMVKLCWRDVCFATRMITIQALNTKTLKTRQVVMTQRLYDELLKLWLASDKDLNARVFDHQVFRKCFATACKEAGIKHGGIDGLTLHCLRHTAATRLVKGQMPIQMVGRILGRCQPQTTYRYLSANTETMRQAAAILDSFHAADSDSLTDAPQTEWVS
jgi:integrase